MPLRLPLRLTAFLLASLLVAGGASAQHKTDRADARTPSGVVDRSLSAAHLGGVHVLRADADGNLVCDEATEAEVSAARRAAPGPVNLTPLRSLNPPEELGGLRIILRATDQLLDQPAALLAFRRAAARWERTIQTPITAVIDVDYGPERFGGGPYNPGVIASASSALSFAGFGPGGAPFSSGEIVEALELSTDDPQLLALYDAIPVPTPSTFNLVDGDTTSLGAAIGGLIPLQALGFFDADIDPDPALNPFGTVPNIGFNLLAYDFDPTDGIDADATDFEAIVVHEIGHTLGFVTAIGFGVDPPFFTPWDLFRVRPDAVEPGEDLTDGEGFETALRVVTPGPPNSDTLVVENDVAYLEPVQVFFDGLAEVETSTSTGAGTGGDGRQGSHWRDDALRPPSLGDERYIGIMDPNFGAGDDRRPYPFDSDLRLLEVIGYQIDYDPPTAEIALSLDGAAIEDGFLVDEIALGEVDAGGSRTVPIRVANVGAENVLGYELLLEVERTFPDDADVTLSLSQTEGTVAPTEGDDLTLTVETTEDAAFVAARLLVRTNDADQLVIDVPFTFSVGGASEPSAAVTYGLPADGDLGDIGADEMESFTVTLANEGSLGLGYRVATSIARRALPLSTVPPARRAQTTVFAADFENPADLSQFTVEAETDAWQVTDGGAAALEGHSQPNAAYFGTITGSGDDRAYTYSNNASGALITPALDLSGFDASDAVRVSFAYVLDAEEGFDFASVAYTLDGGESYIEVATSDEGILQNTDVWETVTIEVPGLAGYDGPVQVAFFFDTDGGVVAEGWFLDDIAVDVDEGAAQIYAEPFVGEVGGNASQEITVTLNGANIARGFYRGSVQPLVEQRADDPAPATFTFTVDDPALPSVVAADATLEVEVPEEGAATFDFTFSNGGDAPLAYLRILEPALRSFDPPVALRNPAALLDETVAPPSERASEVRDSGAGLAAARQGSAILGELEIGEGLLLFDVTQRPDGTVVAVSGGSSSQTQLIVVDAELDGIEAIYSGELGAQATGLAYDPTRDTYWVGLFQSGTLVEVELAEDLQFAPTGNVVDLGFAPFGVAYSPELDAFVVGLYATVAVTVVDRQGRTAPGFPRAVLGRVRSDVGVTALPVVSFTRGVLEVTGAQNELIGHDQFGNPFAEADTTVFAPADIGGATGFYGGVRSATDPDGSFYVSARPSQDDGVARLYRFDPADLPDYVAAPRVRAAEPFFANAVPVGADSTVTLTVDASGLAAGTYAEDLALLTNNALSPVVRIPVEITVLKGTSTETAAPGRFALLGSAPNPVRARAEVRFELPTSAEVTATLYDALGRRVRTLARGQRMPAGPASLTLDAAGLTAGVYFVQIQTEHYGGTQKVVVLQ